MSKRFTQEEYTRLKNAAVDMRNNGVPYRQISQNLGIAMSTVRDYVCDNGLRTMHNNGQTDRWKRYDIVKRMLAENKTQDEIASVLGLSPYTVEKYIRDIRRGNASPEAREMARRVVESRWQRPAAELGLREINWSKHPRFEDIKLKSKG